MIRAYEGLMRVCYAVACGVALALFAVIFAGIVSRQLSHPLIWSNEASIALFVWLIFLGAAVAAAENAHIRVMLLPNALPEVPRRILLLAVTYVGAAILLAVLIQSVRVAHEFASNQFVTLPISAAWDWSAIPTGIAIVLAGWIRHGSWTWRQAGEIHGGGTEPVI